MNYYGKAYLIGKLKSKEARAKLRYKYYEQKFSVKDFGISTPPNLRGYSYPNGWCTKAVDALADRLEFKGFEDAKDYLSINYMFNENNPKILYKSSILSALINSCSFVYIRDDGDIKMQSVDGMSATGILDPITNLQTEGYVVIERDDKGNVLSDVYMNPEHIVINERGNVMTEKNESGLVTIVPIIYKPDANRPYGRSRISRSCMNICQQAGRTIKRAETASEFYSFPQKYVTGMSKGFEDINVWRAAMSSMMLFEEGDDGRHPIPGQFQQGSMSPHVEMMKMHASQFAGETGLTLDDLGFSTDNPSSAEAIKASHESLRLIARSAQSDFESGFLNAGYVAACLRDEEIYPREILNDYKAIWSPIFEPDAAMLSQIGDGALKINQAIPEYVTKNTMRDLTGVEPDDTVELSPVTNE